MLISWLQFPLEPRQKIIIFIWGSAMCLDALMDESWATYCTHQREAGAGYLGPDLGRIQFPILFIYIVAFTTTLSHSALESPRPQAPRATTRGQIDNRETRTKQEKNLERNPAQKGGGASIQGQLLRNVADLCNLWWGSEVCVCVCVCVWYSMYVLVYAIIVSLNLFLSSL